MTFYPGIWTLITCLGLDSFSSHKFDDFRRTWHYNKGLQLDFDFNTNDSWIYLDLSLLTLSAWDFKACVPSVNIKIDKQPKIIAFWYKNYGVVDRKQIMVCKTWVKKNRWRCNNLNFICWYLLKLLHKERQVKVYLIYCKLIFNYHKLNS